MPEQRKRMTYEQQRAKREAESGKPRGGEEARRKMRVLPFVLGGILLVIVIVALRVCSQAMTINVTVNGIPYTLHGAKTVQTAVKESGLPINPGDLISIRGTVLRKSEGEPVSAVVNGRETSDLNYQLHNNDVITVSDGKDIVEDYEISEEITGHDARVSGAGAVHQITKGVDGKMEVRTGKISGEVVRRLVTESTDAVCVKMNPEVGDDKVIALTFEEGPSEEYTAEILDILKENDAKATFFCVGIEVEKYNDELVKRERDEGHQVATGTYDNARSFGGLTVENMTSEEIADQVQHGLQVLEDALDGEGLSNIVRLPGGKINESMVCGIDQYVTANIGWNVDTGDWMESGASEIYHVLMSVEAGDIVRLHDGGGEHSGTVAALREALPQLREQGFTFVTIDDLLKYPPQT